VTVDLALVRETDAQNPIAGDLRLDGTDVVLVEGIEALEQEIRVRLLWWRAEWFLDLRQGVPYLEQLLGKGVSVATIRSVLRAEIEAVPGVVSVPSIEIDLDGVTRFATVSIEVLAENGETLDLDDVPVGGG
jgi:hypothetical protein